MTAPTALVALDTAYRATQARTAIAVAQIVYRLWSSVRADDLSGTGASWLERSVRAVLAGQDRAAQTADAYVEQVRRLQAPGAAPFTPPRRPPNAEQVRKSLEFQAISKTARELFRVESVRAGELERPDVDSDSADRSAEGRRRQLMEAAITRTAGSAVRLVTVAGHEQIYDAVKADPVARGWCRTTKPGCCFFCAMLASRGFVYKEDSFEESDLRHHGPGNHKVHDFCGCGLRPSYGEDVLPDRNVELEQLWIDMKDLRKPGETDIQAWRRIYEASPLAASLGG